MPNNNSWQSFANFLKSYFVDSRPEWQQFLGNYSADPYQKGVLDEVQRRGATSRGDALGEVAGMFGSMGRGGGGVVTRAMRDTASESLSQEQGLLASLKSQDWNQFNQNKMGALGKLTDADMAARANLTQGRGDSFRKQSANLASTLQHQLGMAGIDLGYANLGFDKFKYGDMAPYNKLGMTSNMFGNLASLFSPRYSQGEQTNPGAGINPWMAGLGGAAGGAATGYGMSGGGGKGGSANSSTSWMPGANTKPGQVSW